MTKGFRIYNKASPLSSCLKPNNTLDTSFLRLPGVGRAEFIENDILG